MAAEYRIKIVRNSSLFLRCSCEYRGHPGAQAIGRREGGRENPNEIKNLDSNLAALFFIPALFFLQTDYPVLYYSAISHSGNA